MNIDRITKLRDHLVWLKENDKTYKFDMSYFITHCDHSVSLDQSTLRQTYDAYGINEPISPYQCGTVACLAGHTALLFNDDVSSLRGVDVEDNARYTLDLTEDESCYMFFGYWHETRQLCDITIDETIEYLTRVIDNESIFVSLRKTEA